MLLRFAIFKICFFFVSSILIFYFLYLASFVPVLHWDQLYRLVISPSSYFATPCAGSFPSKVRVYGLLKLGLAVNDMIDCSCMERCRILVICNNVFKF